MRTRLSVLVLVVGCFVTLAAGSAASGASDTQHPELCGAMPAGEIRLGTTCYATIQQAIDAAQPGDVVCVGPGTYRQRIVLAEGVSVVGAGAGSTFLDGNEGGTVVTMASGSSLIGVTVKNTGLGPFFHDDPNLEKRAGVLAEYCEDICLVDLEVTRCKDGIYLVVSSGTITRCRIFDCDRPGESEDGEIQGHALACLSSRFLIENLLSADNNGGSVLVNWEGSNGTEIRNSTIVADGIGIMCQGTSAAITNCIVIGGIMSNAGAIQPKVSFTCVWDDYWPRYNEEHFGRHINCSGGSGGLYDDPLFVDPENGDYRLRPDSPCIDAGDLNLLDPDGSRSDMGAFGGPDSNPSQTPSSLSLFIESLDRVSGRVVVNGVDTRRPTTPFTFSWGDGQQDEGWLPMEHSYSDPSWDYVVTVTAHYTGAETATRQITVGFVAAHLGAANLDESGKILFVESHEPLWTNQTGKGLVGLCSILKEEGIGWAVHPQGEIAVGDLDGVCLLVIGYSRSSFSAQELDAIEAFVWNGGGLLLMGEGWSWSGDISAFPLNQVASRFKCTITAGEGEDPISVGDHPVLDGVSSLRLVGYSPIACSEGDVLARDYMEEPVAIALTVGAGRVVVIGDSDVFTDVDYDEDTVPMLEEADNSSFTNNVLDWLMAAMLN